MNKFGSLVCNKYFNEQLMIKILLSIEYHLNESVKLLSLI